MSHDQSASLPLCTRPLREVRTRRLAPLSTSTLAVNRPRPPRPPERRCLRSLLELPVDAVLSLCDLSHYHCLGLEGPRATSHAVSAVKAARSEQPPPVLPGHERTLLPRALWIARKEPPAVGQAKSRLSKAARLEQLVDKQTPART